MGENFAFWLFFILKKQPTNRSSGKPFLEMDPNLGIVKKHTRYDDQCTATWVTISFSFGSY